VQIHSGRVTLRPHVKAAACCCAPGSDATSTPPDTKRPGPYPNAICVFTPRVGGMRQQNAVTRTRHLSLVGAPPSRCRHEAPSSQLRGGFFFPAERRRKEKGRAGPGATIGRRRATSEGRVVRDSPSVGGTVRMTVQDEERHWPLCSWSTYVIAAAATTTITTGQSESKRMYCSNCLACTLSMHD